MTKNIVIMTRSSKMVVFVSQELTLEQVNGFVWFQQTAALEAHYLRMILSMMMELCVHR